MIIRTISSYFVFSRSDDWSSINKFYRLERGRESESVEPYCVVLTVLQLRISQWNWFRKLISKLFRSSSWFRSPNFSRSPIIFFRAAKSDAREMEKEERSCVIAARLHCVEPSCYCVNYSTVIFAWTYVVLCVHTKIQIIWWLFCSSEQLAVVAIFSASFFEKKKTNGKQSRLFEVA